MSDRAEPRERETSPKSDYKDDRNRDTKDYAPPSKDYARDFPPREYPPAKDYVRGNGGHENKIYVGGLNYSATKDDLYDAFSKAGKVLHVQLVVDHETQRSKGYAFITFADEDAYLYAIKRMNGTVIKGRNVVINKALNAEEKAQWERERGVNREHRDREPPGGRYAPPRHHYNSDRPHFDKPPGPKNVGYRVTITGLPATYTWRELKDFLRNTTNAQPTYANVERPGHGVGEWGTESERSNAMRLLNGLVHEGCKIRCELLEPGPDGYGPSGGGSYHRSDRGGGQDDPGYSRGERGRGGGGSSGYDDRYYGGSYEGSGRGGGGGGGGGGGSYDDRYPERYSSRGEGGGRSGGHEGSGGRYEGGGGGRYEGGGSGRHEGGGGGRYDGGGYSTRDGGREPAGYVREPAGGGGYGSGGPREPGYSSRDGGRDHGGYGPGGGGSYGSRDGGAYGPGGGGGGGGGGYSSRDGGGRGGGGGGGGGYDDRYVDKYSGRGGDYGGTGGGRPGSYDAEGGRGGRYDDAGYEGSRREPGYGPPSKDPYGGPPAGGRDRDGGYGPRDYGGSRGGGGGRDPGYERGSAPYERAGGGGGGGRDAGYDRDYDRGGDGYGYESGAGGGGAYKSGGGGGGGYGGSGRAPPPSGTGASRGGGGYAADGYEGSGRGGPDRSYSGGRGAGYERSAPY